LCFLPDNARSPPLLRSFSALSQRAMSGTLIRKLVSADTNTKGRLAPALNMPGLKTRLTSRRSRFRAAARRSAVRALVASAAAGHDRAARRARRRALLVLNRRERRGLLRIRGPGAAWRVSSRFHVERQLLGRRDGYLFAIVHAGAELGFRRQELR